ncbi:MAG: type II secretion system protein, partial [Verrucomicrobiaceae bacterium]|nr:type II secretion system protein [Verrucomicrobiaceae bacterium]
MKTQPHTHCRRPRAFTLMELLVVILIISILAGFLVPQIIEMMKQKDILKTSELIVKLKTGISSFQTEYNRLPADSGPPVDTEVLTDGSTPLIDVLMGIPPHDPSANWNPKGTIFAEFPLAKNERNGLVTTGRPYKLHDVWGNPFHILLDLDGDHQVPNPDASNSDPKIATPGGKPASATLPTDNAIFSAGKDGVPHTGDDI